MVHKLRDLEIYILSEKLSNIIWNIVILWNYFERDTIGKQLVRAIDSVSANIAESHGRYHYKDKLKFGYYARGSFEETKSWLQKCYVRKLVGPDEQKAINMYIKRIGPRLNSFINTYKYPKPLN